MKIYRLTILDDHEGAVLSWHANRREAEQALRREQRECNEPVVGIVDAVDFPTDKHGLLSWLNTHFYRDNG